MGLGVSPLVVMLVFCGEVNSSLENKGDKILTFLMLGSLAVRQLSLHFLSLLFVSASMIFACTIIWLVIFSPEPESMLVFCVTSLWNVT